MLSKCGTCIACEIFAWHLERVLFKHRQQIHLDKNALMCSHKHLFLNIFLPEVVLVAEVMKLFVSGYLAVTERAETGTLQKHFNFSEIDGDASDAVGNGAGKLLWLASHSEKIIVLVVLYSIANMLSYYALARVDASVYTVLLQVLAAYITLFASSCCSLFLFRTAENFHNSCFCCPPIASEHFVNKVAGVDVIGAWLYTCRISGLQQANRLQCYDDKGKRKR